MTIPRFRTPKIFGERSEESESSDPKKVFYIFCEGKETEKQYFDGIFNYRSELNIDQLIDIRVVEQAGKEHISHPEYILKGCINFINDMQKSPINYDENIDELWIVFDRDPGQLIDRQFDSICEKCDEHKIHIGFTNPEFEFWLLLHLPDADQYDKQVLLENARVGGTRSKRFIEKQLSDRLDKGYNKRKIRFERFLPLINMAIEQEKLFSQDVQDIYHNVGSNIGTLISKMRSNSTE